MHPLSSRPTLRPLPCPAPLTLSPVPEGFAWLALECAWTRSTPPWSHLAAGTAPRDLSLPPLRVGWQIQATNLASGLWCSSPIPAPGPGKPYPEGTGSHTSGFSPARGTTNLGNPPASKAAPSHHIPGVHQVRSKFHQLPAVGANSLGNFNISTHHRSQRCWRGFCSSLLHWDDSAER